MRSIKHQEVLPRVTLDAVHTPTISRTKTILWVCFSQFYRYQRSFKKQPGPQWMSFDILSIILSTIPSFWPSGNPKAWNSSLTHHPRSKSTHPIFQTKQPSLRHPWWPRGGTPNIPQPQGMRMTKAQFGLSLFQGLAVQGLCFTWGRGPIWHRWR